MISKILSQIGFELIKSKKERRFLKESILNIT